MTPSVLPFWARIRRQGSAMSKRGAPLLRRHHASNAAAALITAGRAEQAIIAEIDDEADVGFGTICR
jgi:hypothetical protein